MQWQLVLCDTQRRVDARPTLSAMPSFLVVHAANERGLCERALKAGQVHVFQLL